MVFGGRKDRRNKKETGMCLMIKSGPASSTMNETGGKERAISERACTKRHSPWEFANIFASRIKSPRVNRRKVPLARSSFASGSHKRILEHDFETRRSSLSFLEYFMRNIVSFFLLSFRANSRDSVTNGDPRRTNVGRCFG